MRLLALALGLCLVVSPAFAAAITQISGTGTGGAISNVTYSASSPLTSTTTADIPPNSLAVAIVQSIATGSTLSCSDSFGNTWQAAANAGSGTNAQTQMWYSLTTNDIPNSSTIPCTSSVLGGGFTVQLLAFSNATAFDTAPTGTSGAGTSTTIGPTATLACPSGGTGCDVCVSGVMWQTSGTITSDAAWTATGNNGVSGNWANGFKIVNANTALSFTGSDGTGGDFAGAMSCFKNTATASSSYGGGTTIGVGH